MFLASMTRPCVTKVLVPSNIGSARFSNTNAIVVNWTDPIRIDKSQDPNTLSAAPVTPWNRIPVQITDSSGESPTWALFRASTSITAERCAADVM